MRSSDTKYVGFSEDPAGFFHIYLDETARNIIVEHYVSVVKDVGGGRRRTVSGKYDRIFKGGKAETLYRTVIAHVPQIMADHAAYLGYELGKAEIALKNRVRYEQDKSLKL